MSVAERSRLHEFLSAKSHLADSDGFAPLFMPDFLFDFQAHLTEWSIRKGRAALFEDCGLGKTPQELVFAENVIRYTNKPVLLLTPLAVGAQVVKEGEKFGIDCKRSRDGKAHRCVTVANYEILSKFNPHDFSGLICDESSILKNFDGATRGTVTEFAKKIPYRLLGTATAAPNDFIELGTSSEALGGVGFIDMLNRFFKNEQNNSGTGRMYGEGPKWRFKGHAETPFWRWVCSWARAVRKPSDLGFEDGGFLLPPITENFVNVSTEYVPDGALFSVPASTLIEQRKEKRNTIEDRCAAIAERVNHTGKPAAVWCQLNDEGDLLERMIPDSIQVSGKDCDDAKEEKLTAFSTGKARVIVTKPKIGAWGLNWQHCAHVCYFPSHSYEQYYQAIRRCWRFGQASPVTVDIPATEGEKMIVRNMKEKAEKTDRMFESLVSEMNRAEALDSRRVHAMKEEIPSWF